VQGVKGIVGNDQAVTEAPGESPAEMLDPGLGIEQNAFVFPQRQVADGRIEEHVFRAEAAATGLFYRSHHQQIQVVGDFHAEARHHIIHIRVELEHRTPAVLLRVDAGFFLDVVAVQVERHDRGGPFHPEPEGIGQVDLGVFVDGQDVDAVPGQHRGKAGGQGGFADPALAGNYNAKAFFVSTHAGFL